MKIDLLMKELISIQQGSSSAKDGDLNRGLISMSGLGNNLAITNPSAYAEV